MTRTLVDPYPADLDPRHPRRVRYRGHSRVHAAREITLDSERFDLRSRCDGFFDTVDLAFPDRQVDDDAEVTCPDCHRSLRSERRRIERLARP